MATWSTPKIIPIGKFKNFGFTSIGQYAYLIGGEISSGTTWIKNSNVYIYNYVTDSWSLKTSIPSNFEIIRSAIYDGNYIYCFSYTPFSTQPISAYKYDLMYNTWTTLQWTNLDAAVAQYTVVYSNGNVYFFQIRVAPLRSMDIIVYNIAYNQWSSLQPLKYDRQEYGLASIRENIYIIGGVLEISESPPLWQNINRVDILNTSTNTWSEASNMLHGKYSFPCISIGSEIYAIAGQINSTSGQITNVDDTQILNVNSNLWRFGLSAPFSGEGFNWIANLENSLICTNGTIYYIYDIHSANITNPIPTSGFINEKAANTFSWTLESDPAGTAQQSAIFQWRVRGASTVNTINVGTTQSVTVPADTLPQGEFEWRVSAINAAGIEAPFTEWFLLTTIDPKPNKPTGLYPNTGSRDGTKPIQFSWIHNSPMSTPQSAFEVQATYDGGTTWKALSNKVTTAITQFNAAANIILPTDPTGRIGWRVRTYNSDNVVSDWSDTAFFIVHPAPQSPNWISVEVGRSRPLCRWTSVMQVGFQLQVLLGESVVFDNGEIHGTQTEYRIPQFLNNGVYTFRIRIKNIRGLYSAWANRSVSINARHSLNITLRGEPVEGGATLDFDVEVRAGG